MSEIFPVNSCQVCSNQKLNHITNLDSIPLVNDLKENQEENKKYPLHILFCQKCSLLQLGHIISKTLVFPKNYPYTSRNTKVLTQNFSNLFNECVEKIQLNKVDLVIDIGCNDGNLLTFFKNTCRTLGVTPEDSIKKLREDKVDVLQAYFSHELSVTILKTYGLAKVITATYVIAHVEDVHDLMKGIQALLHQDGIFICEFHYVVDLLEDNQVDAIYHEHPRFFSLNSITHLFNQYELEIFEAKKISTHGGSIRVFSRKMKKLKIFPNIESFLKNENLKLNINLVNKFFNEIQDIKNKFKQLMLEIKKNNSVIYALGAPSRATALVHFLEISSKEVPFALEVNESMKLNYFIPGTDILIVSEEFLKDHPPDFLLLFSWHLSEAIISKVRQGGFKGRFIIPLPIPAVI